jgi:cyclophilin family peptidyl-prolyl cis-trans isomerase
MMNKRIFFGSFFVLVGCLVFFFQMDHQKQREAFLDLKIAQDGMSQAYVLVKTVRGDMKIRFFPEDAPKTVSRFIELVQNHFYDNLSFHRVEPGFVIQGGDPLGNGFGGSGQKIPAEFNKKVHQPGRVAMARNGMDIHSADSQFYICLNTLPSLDGQYTVFGQVVEGYDVVKQIQVQDRIIEMRFFE